MVTASQVAIQENREILPGFYCLTVKAPEIASEARPGQFLMIKTAQTLEPFLKRPISINKLDKEKGTISLIYQVIGKGTKLLADMEEGKKIEVLGPLGNGFTTLSEDKTVVLVGGGCGIAPLLALADRLINEKKEVYVLLGAQSKEKLINEQEFRSLGCQVLVATDDGSSGHKGFVTNLLIELKQKTKINHIYCCGPLQMTTQVVTIANNEFIPCQISLEERMGCGIGACIGCVVKVRDESSKLSYKRVCHDGPVFTSSEVVFDE